MRKWTKEQEIKERYMSYCADLNVCDPDARDPNARDPNAWTRMRGPECADPKMRRVRDLCERLM